MRSLASKLLHPSAQRLTTEQYDRFKTEIRTLYWITKDREGAEGLHQQVLDLIKQAAELDPTRFQDIQVPLQPSARQPFAVRAAEDDARQLAWHVSVQERRERHRGRRFDR